MLAAGCSFSHEMFSLYSHTNKHTDKLNNFFLYNILFGKIFFYIFTNNLSQCYQTRQSLTIASVKVNKKKMEKVKPKKILTKKFNNYLTYECLVRHAHTQ